jgi:hypothetical protein
LGKALLLGGQALANLRRSSEKPVNAVIACQLSFVGVMKFFGDLDTKYKIV